MKAMRREEKALAQLRRLAAGRADELRAHLADLEGAKRSAQASLDWLEQAVGAEKTAQGASLPAIVDFQRFLEGADMKRKSLEATRDGLTGEIAKVAPLIVEAAIEIRKLDHLVAIKAEAAIRARAVAEAAAQDEAAVQRRVR